MADDATGGAGTTYTQEQLDAKIAEANKALQANRDELLDEVKGLKRSIKVFDGIDPEQYKAMAAKLADLEQKHTADKAGMTSEALAQLRADVAADLEKRYATDPAAGMKAFPWAAELAHENRALKLDSVVKAEMARAGARAERVDALFKLTSERFDLTDDGKPMLRDKPATDLSKYLADELRKEYPELYNGSGSTGGGASKSSAGGSGFQKQIAADDGAAFLDNLEAIAAGKVDVVM